MSYGTSRLDVGKAVVLLSCFFNIIMIAMVATDPSGVIASPHSGGWWDTLRTVESADAAHIYPRIWSSFLLFQLIVRLNWVFTVETAPALYRCVLMSYMIPFLQYVLEAQIFKTLPPLELSMITVMTVPWLAIVFSYPKYTTEKPRKKKRAA